MNPAAFAGRRWAASRLALSAFVVIIAASTASAGTYANWTASVDAATGTVSTGTVDVTLDGASSMSSDVNNVGPGDSMQRLASFRNSGTIELSSVTLAATGTADFATLAPYLTLDIATCAVAWNTTGNNQYQCPTSQTTALVSTTLAALSASPATLAGLQTAPGQSTPLRFTLTLSNAAPKSVQNKSTRITYSMTAVPRAARSL